MRTVLLRERRMQAAREATSVSFFGNQLSDARKA
jgi:hypothetical protein